MARKLPLQLKHDTYSDRAYVRHGGKKKYFGKWGSSDSFERFAEWLNQQAAKAPAEATPQSDITIAECASRYLVFAEGYYSEDGSPSQEFANVRKAVETVVAHSGGYKVANFGPKRLKHLRTELAVATIERPDPDDEEKKIVKLKYARTTINAMINRIRRWFRWCASEELIPIEIVTALETVNGIPVGRQMAREPEPVRPVSFEVVADTLPYLSPTVAAMVQVQALCGMRPQDVCNMTTGAIETSGDVWLYRPQRHKGSYRGQELVKGIPAPAQELLRSLLRPSLEEPIFSPLDSKQHFKNAPTKRARRTFYTTSSYGKSIVYAIAAAGKKGESIPHWTPNQLRHAIATELRRTAGLEAAQVYLGHSKPDTTLIYAEQTKAALIAIARDFVSPLPQRPPRKLGSR